MGDSDLTLESRTFHFSMTFGKETLDEEKALKTQTASLKSKATNEHRWTGTGAHSRRGGGAPPPYAACPRTIGGERWL